VAAALAVAGCTTSASGQATPAPNGSTDGSAPNTSESSGPTPTVEIPARPRDISLEGLDPCTLYTEQQRAQLQVDDVKSAESNAQNYQGMKHCSLDKERQEPFYGYDAMAVTFEGADVWLTGERNVDAELASVQGFPAAKLKLRGSQELECVFAVEVADKQSLMVEVAPATDGYTQDQLCQMAEEAANMAMTTLQTLR
jgi:hypothetical protein